MSEERAYAALTRRAEDNQGAIMHDEKRQLRILKRELKRIGNRQRRRFLKNLDAVADDFDFGRLRTEPLNERRSKKERRPPRTERDDLEA